jgi:diketogulonate reductase-like aldo/keto reductase
MKTPDIELGDGRKIPQVGLGLWRVKDEAEFDRSFDAAVANGYTHFDTAQVYQNEQFLGTALKKSALKRSDVWITTKISVEHFGHKRAKQSFEESLEKLQTDYVDLLLLHFPVTLLRKKTWQAAEEIKAAGKAKSIGVSNYTIRHLKEMESYAKEMPAVNQVELHVFLQQPELIEYCHAHNIAVEAYSPLAHARAMDEPAIAAIAKKHAKTYAQIMLRWCVEKDLIVLPKSVTPERVAQNIDIFDFSLDDEDMEQLTKLDRDLRTCWSPVHVP